MNPAVANQQALRELQEQLIDASANLANEANVANVATPVDPDLVRLLNEQKNVLDQLVAEQAIALQTEVNPADKEVLAAQQLANLRILTRDQQAALGVLAAPQAGALEIVRQRLAARQAQQPVVQPAQPAPDKQAVNEILRQIQYKAIFKKLQDAQEVQATQLAKFTGGIVIKEELHEKLRNLFQQKKQVAEEAIDEEIAAAFPQPQLAINPTDLQQTEHSKAVAGRAKAMADYKKAFLAEQGILIELVKFDHVIARDELERLLPANENPGIREIQEKAIEEIRALDAQIPLIDEKERKNKVAAEKKKFDNAIDKLNKDSKEAEAIKVAFSAQIEAAIGKERLLRLPDAEQQAQLAAKEAVADQAIADFKLKYGTHSELSRVIREVVASRVDLGTKVVVSRELDEGLENGLPEEIGKKFKTNAKDLVAPDANATKDAQDKYKTDVEKQKNDRKEVEIELTNSLRMPGSQPKSMKALFEAQLINSLEELKDIEPFKQFKDESDFIERARKIFSDESVAVKKKILRGLADGLKRIVENDGAKMIAAEPIQAGGQLRDVINVLIYNPAAERDGNTESEKKARLLRVMKSLVMYGGDRAKPANIFNKDALHSDIEYTPGTLKNEDIEKQQKALIKAVKELKEDHDKQMAKVFGTPDEVKKNKEDLEKKLQQDIIEKEKNLLVDHGFVPVRGADGKGVAGLYCCSREGDDKTVYTVRGGHGTDFIQQIDAIILDNRSRVDENGDQVKVGRCTFINIDQKDKERAIIECLKQNSECSFKSKPEHVGVPHPCSVVLTAINAIREDAQDVEALKLLDTANKKQDFVALCFPAIDALNKMESCAGGWGEAKAHMASTNKRNFLEYTKNDDHAVGKKIKTDIENIIIILGSNDYSKEAQEAARKAAKIMQVMIKGNKVDTYSAYSKQLETSLDDLEKREKDKKDEDRRGIKLE